MGVVGSIGWRQAILENGEMRGSFSAPTLIVWIGFVWRSLKIAAERGPFIPAPVSTLQRLSRTSGIVCCAHDCLCLWREDTGFVSRWHHRAGSNLGSSGEGAIRIIRFCQKLGFIWGRWDKDEQPETLSLIIPCYNEERTLANCIERVLAIATADLGLELIIVDDSSEDRSLMVAHELAKHHP